MPDELLEAAQLLPLLVIPVAERRMLGLDKGRRRNSVQVQVVLNPGNVRRSTDTVEKSATTPTSTTNNEQQYITNNKIGQCE